MSLSIDHQKLLISQKEKQPEMFCLMMEVANYICEIVFPKWSNLNYIQLIILNTNLQEIQGRKECVKWSNRNSVTCNHLENSTIQMSQSLFWNCKKEKQMEVIYRLKET